MRDGGCLTIWAIVGSVSFELDLEAQANFKSILRGVLKPSDFIVCGGGAVGPDRWTQEVAREVGCDYEAIKGTISERDNTIVESCDQMMVFWDGVTKATVDILAKAVAAKKVVTVHNPSSDQLKLK